ELFSVLFAKPKEDVLITSANGMTIRFNEEDVRPMGLVAAGVNGMKLKDDDFVIGTGIVSKGDSVIVMTNAGSAKRIEESEFPVQGRYGQGVITWKLTDNEKVVVQLIGKLGERAICHFEKAASKFFKISDAPLRSRMAKGKNIIDVKTKDEIIGFTKINDMVDYWEKI
ncbi:MAG: hypothetical protein MUO40_11715, partial [Anaerolineaceae bacterium]|nr:hypothetical protein [Anaerolineaceae bacterium]